MRRSSELRSDYPPVCVFDHWSSFGPFGCLNGQHAYKPRLNSIVGPSAARSHGIALPRVPTCELSSQVSTFAANAHQHAAHGLLGRSSFVERNLSRYSWVLLGDPWLAHNLLLRRQHVAFSSLTTLQPTCVRLQFLSCCSGAFRMTPRHNIAAERGRRVRRCGFVRRDGSALFMRLYLCSTREPISFLPTNRVRDANLQLRVCYMRSYCAVYRRAGAMRSLRPSHHICVRVSRCGYTDWAYVCAPGVLTFVPTNAETGMYRVYFGGLPRAVRRGWSAPLASRERLHGVVPNAY